MFAIVGSNVSHVNGRGSIFQGQIKGALRQKKENKSNVAVPACFGKYHRSTINDCKCFYRRECSGR